MASDEGFVVLVCEHIEGVGTIRYRKMFGEFAIYCNEKIVALVCDNKLYVKPTNAGRALIGNVVEEPPYKGAKPSFRIEQQFEDTHWFSRLIEITEKELPEPKPKRPKKKSK